MNAGIWYALGAYVLWGLFPIYWKWLQHVPALQVIGHRIGWSFILLMAVILVTKQWTKFRSALTRRVLGVYLDRWPAPQRELAGLRMGRQ